MKKNNHDQATGGPAARRIRIEFTHQSAASVKIAGSFNGWRPDATPMLAVGEGKWAKELMLPPGQYEYCVVVDGNYLPDPNARQSAPNPFGGVNSVLSVAAPARPEKPGLT